MIEGKVLSQSIQVFDTGEQLETFNSEIEEEINIGSIGGSVCILIKELSGKRTVIGRRIIGIILSFYTGRQKQVFVEIAFKGNPVSEKQKRNIDRRSTGGLLQMGIDIPVEIFIQLKLLFRSYMQYIE